MRFIHTADWHLGRIFHGHHLTEDQAYVLKEFEYIVKDSKAEAVLVAGDIYDRAVPPIEAVELLDETLSHLLLDLGVKVIMIAGNHDSAQRVGFASRLLKDRGFFVKGVLDRKLEPVVLEDVFGPVYFMPYTYAEPVLVRAVFSQEDLIDFDMATAYVVKQGLSHLPADCRKVALAHAFIAGGIVTDSERPLSVGGSSNVRAAHFKPFDYTALGHLHNPQRAGAENIRYSGSLMKYSFDEAGQEKGICIVDMDEKGSVSIEKAVLHPRCDVCRVKGFFDELLQNRKKYPVTEDYMLVELLDMEAILDVRGQLETIYPNLMQIERPNWNVGGELAKERIDYRAKSEIELFGDFFQQMTGTTITEEQEKVFRENVDELFAQEREAK